MTENTLKVVLSFLPVGKENELNLERTWEEEVEEVEEVSRFD